MIRFLLVGFGLLLASAGSAHAQGTLSAQGLGYPAGGISARAAGAGGAIAELDPQSPVNPAALVNVRRPVVFLQYAPEFRRVVTANEAERSTVIRFPLIGAAMPVGQRSVVSLTATTMVDRSWRSRHTGIQQIGDDQVEFVDGYSATGAINEVRLAASRALSSTVALGLGGHLITGESRLDLSRAFTDTMFTGFSQRTVVGYSGAGASAGIAWWPSQLLQVALSGRIGGTLRAYLGDSVTAEGKVPNRASFGAQYAGIAGTLIAARAGWEGWSALTEVSPEQLPAVDAWDFSVGVETRGPTVLGGPMPLRAGLRRRDLPFQAPLPPETGGFTAVRENAVSFGTGLLLAAQRASVDITALRASRSGHPTVRESGWSLIVGLTVRP